MGQSAIGLGVVIPIQVYFNQRRGFAQGMVMSAFGLAQFVWPPLAEYLVRHYSLPGTFITLAGIQLQGCLLGALLRPKDPSSVVLTVSCDEPLKIKEYIVDQPYSEDCQSKMLNDQNIDCYLDSKLPDLC